MVMEYVLNAIDKSDLPLDIESVSRLFIWFNYNQIGATPMARQQEKNVMISIEI